MYKVSFNYVHFMIFPYQINSSKFSHHCFSFINFIKIYTDTDKDRYLFNCLMSNTNLIVTFNLKYF